MKTRLLQFVTAILFGLTTTGCITSHGPLFSAAKESQDLAIQEGKSLMLIYWQDVMGGVKVYANDHLIAKIGPGKNGFISYQAEPGQLRMSSGVGSGNIPLDVFNYGALQAASGQKEDRSTFDVVDGRTYYVRLQQGFWHETMRLVSEEEAAKEIANCHWQNPPTPHTQAAPLR
jgi:hypothetical protein